MRILIADDHAVFRRGLRETLSEAFSRITFGEAKTAQETLELARRQDWDVIISDHSMPVFSAPAALASNGASQTSDR